jgi:hypothetical protein
LLLIGLRATADALTEDGGDTPSPAPAHQAMSAGGLVGIRKTSHSAKVIFASDGHFTETGLPGPLPARPAWQA